MRTLPLLTFALLFLGGAALASRPSETPPPAPLLASAPASSQWTVTYKPKASEKKTVSAAELRNRKLRQRYSPQVLSTHSIKAPGKMVVYTTYEAGLKSEAWVVGNYLYELPFRDGESMQISTKGANDFPEISWVSAANFRGSVEIKKRQVHLYETGAAQTPPTPAASAQPEPAPTEGTPDKTGVRRAYIDAETRLPVKVETESMVMTYQFDPPPTVFPEMDPRVAEQLNPSK